MCRHGYLAYEVVLCNTEIAMLNYVKDLEYFQNTF